MQEMYNTLWTAALIALAVGLLLSLIRVIRGPRIADRILGVNMIGTQAMCILSILSILLNQSYLLDVGLIHCMISFLAVVVLTKVYITVHLRAKKNRKEGK